MLLVNSYNCHLATNQTHILYATVEEEQCTTKLNYIDSPQTMTRIVPYRIAFTSSEDDDATASELLSPGPSSRGWASDKYCTYPQASIFSLFFSYFTYRLVMCRERDQSLRESFHHLR